MMRRVRGFRRRPTGWIEWSTLVVVVLAVVSVTGKQGVNIHAGAPGRGSQDFTLCASRGQLALLWHRQFPGANAAAVGPWRWRVSGLGALMDLNRDARWYEPADVTSRGLAGRRYVRVRFSLVLVAGVLVLGCAVRRVLAARGRGGWVCPSCGYALAGTSGGVCPECGDSIGDA